MLLSISLAGANCFCRALLFLLILCTLLVNGTAEANESKDQLLNSAASSNLERIEFLNKQIAPLISEQKYAQALPLAKEALDLNQNQKGVSDLSNVRLLNNLGWLEQQIGEFADARRRFENACSISEKSVSTDGEYAWSLNNLAMLLYMQGDFETAKSKFEKSLHIQESRNDNLKSAMTLRNLAGVLDALGKGDEALSAYRKAVSILEAEPQSDKLELARALEDLASSLEDKTHFDESADTFARALSIKESLLGKEHAELAVLHNNLGILKLDTGKKDEAETYFREALSILEKTRGKDHIDLVPVLNNLGDLCLLNKKNEEAASAYLHALSIINKYLKEIVPYCSQAEQQAAYDLYSRDQVSRLLSACGASALLPAAYEGFFAWKGSLVSSLSRQAKIKRKFADSEELSKLAGNLSNLRSELASWYLEAGNTSRRNWQERNEKLCSQKEEIERRISSEFNCSLEINANLNFSDFSGCLGPDEAFIDIYKYDQFRGDERGGDLLRNSRYCAIVIYDGKVQKMFDLGDATMLQVQMKQWRNKVLSMQAAALEWKRLTDILALPFGTLPAQSKKVFLCPDDELARLPWQLVAADNPAGKNLALCQIDSARQLYELRRERQVKPETSSSVLFLLGGVDFNAGAAECKISPIQMPFLEGTVRETRDICELGKKRGLTIIELSGAAANKAALREFLPKAQYAHLATHGFFFDESFMSQAMPAAASAASQDQTGKSASGLRAGASSESSRSIVLKTRYDSNLSRRNPLIESGLMLAGANKICLDKNGGRCGVITAEEFLDTDLSKCKLIVLSACDTGRGQELTGQGIMGLRASVMAAGCDNVLMSLWKVPDEPTALLMNEFYKNLWLKKLSPSESLRAAQLSMKAIAPAANPAGWAGWVLVGEGF